MRKRELDHVLRAAGRITGSTRFIIVGSQALHAAHPDLADDIIKSIEVDLWAANAPERSEWLNAISYGSQFHETFGYYADPVDEDTATLPKGWRSRLIDLPPGDTEGVVAQCLDPHDLAIAKYVAARDKDLVFTSELARRGIVSEERLLSLLQHTALEETQRERIRAQIGRDFHAATGEMVRDAGGGAAPAGASADLEAIKARARVNWLRMRNKERGRSIDEPEHGLTPDPDDGV
jgi:hypothetical protein